MSILLGNSVLRAAEAALERQIAPQNREDYLRVVVAGQKVALNGGENSPFAKLVHTTKNPLRDCALGAVGLVLNMRAESKSTMPMKAAVPGAMALMLYALDLVDKAGIIKVGKPELAEATKTFTTEFFKKAGISNEQLAAAATKLHGFSQNPAHLDAMRVAAGVKPAPGVGTVTVGGANGGV